ncbi:hypothetical protein DEO72_LG1g2799 [Vigna unguiculata]|uniref:Secreted protein n=1 Tax=Vigna unguiculata TaxID=3917 RepID=A0A4D6KR63_VIGUN|nr:hypothetical protein DEO72_LG1g2799 [Vigna unguiculata]
MIAHLLPLDIIIIFPATTTGVHHSSPFGVLLTGTAVRQPWPPASTATLTGPCRLIFGKLCLSPPFTAVHHHTFIVLGLPVSNTTVVTAI